MSRSWFRVLTIRSFEERCQPDEHPPGFFDCVPVAGSRGSREWDRLSPAALPTTSATSPARRGPRRVGKLRLAAKVRRVGPSPRGTVNLPFAPASDHCGSARPTRSGLLWPPSSLTSLYQQCRGATDGRSRRMESLVHIKYTLVYSFHRRTRDGAANSQNCTVGKNSRSSVASRPSDRIASPSRSFGNRNDPR